MDNVLLVSRLEEAEFNILRNAAYSRAADSATVTITAKVSVCVVLETAVRLDAKLSEH